MTKIKSNQKGFGALEGILVLVIVVLIGAVGYLVYKNHHKVALTSATTKSATATPANPTIPKQPANPYAGWSTYTDMAKLFSVMYPPELTSSSPPVHADTPFTLADKNQSEFIASVASNSTVSPLEFWVMAYSTSDMQGVLSKDSFGDKQTTPQSMTINGYQALYGQDIETGAGGTYPTYTKDQYVVTHNGVSLLFSFTEQQGNDANNQTAGAYNYTSDVSKFSSFVKSVKFLN